MLIELPIKLSEGPWSRYSSSDVPWFRRSVSTLTTVQVIAFPFHTIFLLLDIFLHYNIVRLTGENMLKVAEAMNDNFVQELERSLKYSNEFCKIVKQLQENKMEMVKNVKARNTRLLETSVWMWENLFQPKFELVFEVFFGCNLTKGSLLIVSSTHELERWYHIGWGLYYFFRFQ